MTPNRIIKLHHETYGDLRCSVIDRTNGIVTLWCQPFLGNMHFDDPSDEIFAIPNINIAHRAEKHGYPFGYVLQDDDEKSETVKVTNTARYSNIKIYGNNQWPVCSLRSFLNGLFLEGFSPVIRNAVVPTKHDLLISTSKLEQSINGKGKKAPKIYEPVQMNDSTLIYESLESSKRLTYARCTDYVYLPSIDFFNIYKLYEQIELSDSQTECSYFWLMNPSQLFFDDFSVSFAYCKYDERNKKWSGTVSYCNANGMNVTAAPVFRIRESALYSSGLYIIDSMHMNKTWGWRIDDEGRFQNSRTELPVSSDGDSAIFEGNHGTHKCTLTHCDCRDFQFNLKGKEPCKHIMSYGAFVHAYDPLVVERHFKAGPAMQELALAYGYYHLFDYPIMSNEEYDKLKSEWSDLLPGN